MTRTSNTALNRSGKWGRGEGNILVFFLNLEKRLSAFHSWIWCWLWICCKQLLLCWDLFSLYPLWWEFSSWMDVEFVKCFFCIYWDDHVNYIVPMVNAVYHNDWFGMLNHTCDSGIHPNSLWCMIFLHIVRFTFLVFCWEFLYLSSSKILACNFLSFFILSLVLFSG